MPVFLIQFSVVDPIAHPELEHVNIYDKYQVLEIFEYQILIADDFGKPLGLDKSLVRQLCKITRHDLLFGYAEMVVKSSHVKENSNLWNFSIGKRYPILEFNFNKGLLINDIFHAVELPDSVIKNNFRFVTTDGLKAPKVINKHHGNVSKDAVYIGRPSKWGNPFIVGKHGQRGECVDLYEKWIRTQPELIKQIKAELKGKDLVCFCAPQRCHGDVILQIANE